MSLLTTLAASSAVAAVTLAGMDLGAQTPQPYLIKDFHLETASSYAGGFVQVAGTWYFSADDGFHGRELWKSNGTREGTALFKDLYPGSTEGHPERITPVGDRFFFIATGQPTSRDALWISDGTEPGTTRLRDVNFPEYLVAVGGSLFFSATDSQAGQELWASDGTPQGTRMVKDITPGIYPSFPKDMVDLGGTLLFTADVPGGRSIWRSDGTAAGTLPVGTSWTVTPRSGFTVMGGIAYFILGHPAGQIWRTDGTVGGTYLIKNFGSSCDLGGLGRFGSRLYFAGCDATGQELWSSDGTAAGTQRVKDINPGTGSSGRGGFFVEVAGTLFFLAQEPMAGTELWKTDGTEAGTQRVSDIRVGTESTSFGMLMRGGALLYFLANDGSHGWEPWRSDGTPEGTFLLADVMPGPGGSWLGGTLPPAIGPSSSGPGLFSLSEPSHGYEPWRSEGTSATTGLLKDVNHRNGSGSPVLLGVLNNRLYFSADDSETGRELWITDGTEAGTALLADLLPGSLSSSPCVPVQLPQALMLRANTPSAPGLWRVDANGPSLVRDLAYSAGGVLNDVGLLSVDRWESDYGIWRSDGSPQGTQLLAGGVDGSEMVPMGGAMYFGGGTSATGGELWRSDGTPGGTHLVTDLTPGSGGGVHAISAHQDVLYFKSWDETADTIC